MTSLVPGRPPLWARNRAPGFGVGLALKRKNRPLDIHKVDDPIRFTWPNIQRLERQFRRDLALETEYDKKCIVDVRRAAAVDIRPQAGAIRTGGTDERAAFRHHFVKGTGNDLLATDDDCSPVGR